MVHVACNGESGGLPERPFPIGSIRVLRIVLACLLFGLGALALPAYADGLYQCTGRNGETVFTSHSDGYHGCHHLHVQPQQHISVNAPAQRVKLAPKPVPATSAAVLASPHSDTAKVLAVATPAPKQRASARVLRGAVYRVKHADGSIEYTNVSPRGRRGGNVIQLFTYIDSCVACDVHSIIDWRHVPLNLTAYAGAIQQAAVEFGVNPALLHAIIHAESAYNPRAMSIKGAQGLMQLMPATASDMGVLDAFDATQNIRGGARYLALLLKDFKGNPDLAAAAYNAGPGAVQKYSGVPPYQETQVYVQRVDILRKRYAEALQQPPLASR